MQKPNLQQKFLQKLLHQQIQLMKLLQVPTVMLEQRIKQEIEENPALEEDFGDHEESESLYESDDDDIGGMDGGDNDAGDDYENSHLGEFDLSDYIDDDETPTYKLAMNNTSADDEHKDIPFASGISFQDFCLPN